ncbi:hypothetical protein [Halanaerobium praevalens]|uniref:Uncharacterized protein n=1 Tax=Halanaerobium praevalens (strain ATCC 33744 / DSM 2228 / GSL) TaxID=572479 RepID=E3DLE9_HALPG|nr:hypothetical protein [Halanaerobium praevalens]ADO77188.1 hypothetical protein Hprae_1035 [Halanaerobium praevalens DSM 2228]
MDVINLFELDKKAKVVKLDSKEKIEADYFKESNLSQLIQANSEIANISGQWLILDDVIKIDNQHLIYFKDKKENKTFIKLPNAYVEENYLINYEAEDTCPLGVDVLVKENGYPIGIVSGCKSIKQAKVQNDLDGHSYKGQLGFKLNQYYFLNYDQKFKEFRVITIKKDNEKRESFGRTKKF